MQEKSLLRMKPPLASPGRVKAAGGLWAGRPQWSQQGTPCAVAVSEPLGSPEPPNVGRLLEQLEKPPLTTITEQKQFLSCVPTR